MADNMTSLKQSIMREIYQNRMLLTAFRDRKEGWTLVSGLWSPFYIQLRLLSSFPDTLKKTGKAMAQLLRESAPGVTKLVGIAFAGVPIATALSLESGLPACHTRKVLGVKTQEDLVKAIDSYGQHELLEGVLEDGDVLCIVDDLVTGMTSKLVARDQILAEAKRRGIQDIECKDIAVIIDRQQGAKKKAQESELKLHSLIAFVDEGLPAIKDLMDFEEYSQIMSYLKGKDQFTS